MGRFSESEKAELWDRFEAGESLRAISRELGRAPSSVRTHIVAARWRRPVPAGDWCSLRLSFSEREEISRGIAAGVSLRCIAHRLGRASSTVSREVATNGGRLRYRAAVAHRAITTPSETAEAGETGDEPAVAWCGGGEACVVVVAVTDLSVARVGISWG